MTNNTTNEDGVYDPTVWTLMPERGSRIYMNPPEAGADAAAGIPCDHIIFCVLENGLVQVRPRTSAEYGGTSLPQTIELAEYHRTGVPSSLTLWWNDTNTFPAPVARAVWLWAIARGWRLHPYGYDGAQTA